MAADGGAITGGGVLGSLPSARGNVLRAQLKERRLEIATTAE
jgi:hypothetical protein